MVERAKSMRQQAVQYTQLHKEQFRSSVAFSSNTIEEYSDQLKNPAQPCDEVVARAIALSENVNIQLVHFGGFGNAFYGSPRRDEENLIYIGHVEENYYLFLKHSTENREGDIDSSSNRLPVSDSGVEIDGQSVNYRSAAPDGSRAFSAPQEVG